MNLPNGADSGGPWPVVFNWHGMGDNAQNFSGLVSPFVNDPNFSFIAITPNNTNPTAEPRLFKSVLDCLVQHYNVDENHIHAMGFSYGAMSVDRVVVAHTERLASVLSYSGQYASYNNTSPNKYVQVFVHGGNSDAVGINFGQAATKDSNTLVNQGHDVIVCNHGQGHTVPNSMYTDKAIEFFADHPLGTHESPYRSGLPADFPNYCEFKQAAK